MLWTIVDPAPAGFSAPTPDTCAALCIGASPAIHISATAPTRSRQIFPDLMLIAPGSHAASTSARVTAQEPTIPPRPKCQNFVKYATPTRRNLFEKKLDRDVLPPRLERGCVDLATNVSWR